MHYIIQALFILSVLYLAAEYLPPFLLFLQMGSLGSILATLGIITGVAIWFILDRGLFGCCQTRMKEEDQGGAEDSVNSFVEYPMAASSSLGNDLSIGKDRPSYGEDRPSYSVFYRTWQGVFSCNPKANDDDGVELTIL